MPGTFSRPLALLLGAALILGLSACVVRVRAPGPPDHAPAYGYDDDAYYYYYYPSIGVYYHIYTGYYFYRSGGVWLRVRVLPPYLHLDRRDRVRVHIRNKRPYVRDRELKRRYKERPRYRSNGRFDQEERQHNRRSYQEYRPRDDGDGGGKRPYLPAERDGDHGKVKGKDKDYDKGKDRAKGKGKGRENGKAKGKVKGDYRDRDGREDKEERSGGKRPWRGRE